VTITPEQVVQHPDSVANVLETIDKITRYAQVGAAVIPLVQAALQALREAIHGKIDPAIIKIQLADLVDAVRVTDAKHDAELDARFGDPTD
jgi:hypothetical protein